MLLFESASKKNKEALSYFVLSSLKFEAGVCSTSHCPSLSKIKPLAVFIPPVEPFIIWGGKKSFNWFQKHNALSLHLHAGSCLTVWQETRLFFLSRPHPLKFKASIFNLGCFRAGPLIISLQTKSSLNHFKISLHFFWHCKGYHERGGSNRGFSAGNSSQINNDIHFNHLSGAGFQTGIWNEVEITTL